jgi:outer membrane protein assembly factor BamB
MFTIMKKKYFLLAILLIAAWNGFAQPTVEIKWAVSCGTGDINATSPALSPDGNTVYYANGTDGKLYAFNASDGTPAWNFTLGVAKSNPARTNSSVGADGTIYVPVGSNADNSVSASLFAVNPDGTQKWQYTIGNGANITYISPAITKDGDILVGNNGTDGALHLVNGVDGTRKAYIKPSGGVLGAIVVSQNNVAYSQAGNSGFNAYDLNTIDSETLAPAHLGSYKPVDGNFYSVGSPAMDGDGNFLAAGGSGGIVSLHIDNSTLNANWVYPADVNLSKIEQSGVAIGADGTVYVSGSENKKIFALNTDGTLKWEFATNANANSVPAVDNLGYIHFGDDAGNYYILEDKATGAEQIYKTALSDGSITASRVWSSPAIADDGSIYFTAKTADDIYLFKINVEGVTGPANSYWAMRGGNAQRSGLQRNRLWSDDATLQQLEVTPGTLMPDFDANTFSYTVDVAYDVETIDVTGTATDANAVVTGNVADYSLEVGENTVTITVTAEDKLHTSDYVVTVNRQRGTAISGVQKQASFEVIVKDNALEMKASKQGKLTVYNQQGSVLFDKTVKAGSSYTVSVLPYTVYLVKFNNEVAKIIIR